MPVKCVDKKNGAAVHCGYVIAGLWITLYENRPFEKVIVWNRELEKKEAQQEKIE